MSDTPQVYLHIDGEIHSGWTDVSITMALDACASSFSLTMTGGRPIATGQKAQLYIGSKLLLNGYIDGRTGKLSEASITVTGRDKTQDLIDCSALNSPGTWKGVRLEKIAADLCAPFGIKVITNANTGAAFPQFAIEPGESPFDAIARLCVLRGVMISANPTGDLTIFKPSQKTVSWALEEGKNMVDCELVDDASERFSEYHLKGQSSGTTTDAKTATAAKAIAYDKGVIRYRPKLIISDEQSSIAGLKSRANWEATTHAAESQHVNVTTDTWLAPDGKLWELGTLIPVRSDFLDIDMSLCLTDVSLSLGDENGYSATLKLSRPQSFTQEPLPEAKPAKKSKLKKTKKDKDGKDKDKPKKNAELKK